MFYELFYSPNNIQIQSYHTVEDYINNKGKKGIFLDNHNDKFIPKEIFLSEKYLMNSQKAHTYILFGNAETMLNYFLKNLTTLQKKIKKEVLDRFIYELENFRLYEEKKGETTLWYMN